MSKTFEDALEGLPTMSQFANRIDCEKARRRHMWDAGREHGHREGIEAVVSGVSVSFHKLSEEFRAKSMYGVANALQEGAAAILATLSSPVRETGSIDRTHEECAECALVKVTPPQCKGHEAGPVCCPTFVPIKYVSVMHGETEVCEWKGASNPATTGHLFTSCGNMAKPSQKWSGSCPYCGKPISVSAE